MTPASELLDPLVNPVIYMARVLEIYLDLPDTAALRPSPQDRRVAEKLFAEKVPLSQVETALLLGSLRRLGRAEGLPPHKR